MAGGTDSSIYPSAGGWFGKSCGISAEHPAVSVCFFPNADRNRSGDRMHVHDREPLFECGKQFRDIFCSAESDSGPFRRQGNNPGEELRGGIRVKLDLRGICFAEHFRLDSGIDKRRRRNAKRPGADTARSVCGYQYSIGDILSSCGVDAVLFLVYFGNAGLHPKLCAGFGGTLGHFMVQCSAVHHIGFCCSGIKGERFAC